MITKTMLFTMNAAIQSDALAMKTYRKWVKSHLTHTTAILAIYC